jgi:hypothetical protein
VTGSVRPGRAPAACAPKGSSAAHAGERYWPTSAVSAVPLALVLGCCIPDGICGQGCHDPMMAAAEQHVVGVLNVTECISVLNTPKDIDSRFVTLDATNLSSKKGPPESHWTAKGAAGSYWNIRNIFIKISGGRARIDGKTAEPHGNHLFNIVGGGIPEIFEDNRSLRFLSGLDEFHDSFFYHNICSQLPFSDVLHGFYGRSGSISAIPSCISRLFGVGCAFADESQLPDKQRRSGNAGHNQGQGEPSDRRPTAGSPNGFIWLILSLCGFGYGSGFWSAYRMQRRHQKKQIDHDNNRQRNQLPKWCA